MLGIGASGIKHRRNLLPLSHPPPPCHVKTHREDKPERGLSPEPDHPVPLMSDFQFPEW